MGWLRYVEQDSQMLKKIAVTPPHGLEAPPCLEHQGVQQTVPLSGLEAADGHQTVPAPKEYSMDEKVMTLRSNGTWSSGTVIDIGSNKVVVEIEDGVKTIPKRILSSLLRKVEVSPEAISEGAISRHQFLAARVSEPRRRRAIISSAACGRYCSGACSRRHCLRTGIIEQCTADGLVVVEVPSVCAPPPGLWKDDICAPPRGSHKRQQSDSDVSTTASEHLDDLQEYKAIL
jgi:hypothetical protein